MSIELKNVTKKFGGVAAVNNVTFSVKEGELMALLGPSGGGKTTVLRMIAGLEMPTSGDVFIRGQRVNDLSVQERYIGFVFQNYALFKNMNVFRNVAFGLKIKKWKRADVTARVGELSGDLHGHGPLAGVPVAGRPSALGGAAARDAEETRAL